MVLDGDRHVLLAVGDHGHAVLVRDASASYGKLLRVSLDDGAAQTVASGLRSPGGLTRDLQGRLWMTDHGPRGGDEVNLIVPGTNYGWPNVSYGTRYEDETVPIPGVHYGTHDGFEKPRFVFVPSVAPSFLSVYPGTPGNAAWNGDLLMATLKPGVLFRLRVEGERIVYAEPVLSLGRRIREVQVLPTGALLLRVEPDLLVRASIP